MWYVREFCQPWQKESHNSSWLQWLSLPKRYLLVINKKSNCKPQINVKKLLQKCMTMKQVFSKIFLFFIHVKKNPKTEGGSFWSLLHEAWYHRTLMICTVFIPEDAFSFLKRKIGLYSVRLIDCRTWGEV